MARGNIPAACRRPVRPTCAWGAAWMLVAVAGCLPHGAAAADDLEDAFADLEAIERLDALGYAGGYSPAPERTGVLVHDASRAQPGVNLVLSSHHLGATVQDLSGAVVHAWAFNLWAHFPAGEIPAFAAEARRGGWDFWSRAAPLADGGLLFIQKGCGVFHIDRDSRLVRVSWLPAHHDLYRLPDGRVRVLAQNETTGAEQPVDDFIVTLSPEGAERDRISIVRAILDSDHAPLLLRYGTNRPYLHTNKLCELDGAWSGRSPAFRQGNLLVSCRDIDAILVIDPETERVVWSMGGMWHRQHEPRPLPNGNLLLFDNLGHRGHARVLEFDPFTQAVAWTYAGTPPQTFHSPVGGACHRLPNGNTLITESTRGRAFEVTAEKETVWEYVNPHRNGEHIAPLFEVRRLPAWPPADASEP